MSTHPVAVARPGENDSREAQNLRAVRWILGQAGGPLVLVTPLKEHGSESLKRFSARPGVVHRTWRGLGAPTFAGQRVVYAWPDRKHLALVFDTRADSLVVIEWGEAETREWIEDANPVQLLPGATVLPTPANVAQAPELPNGIESILRYVAEMAAGYSSGLKWNEEDMLKADMMNRPDRWAGTTVEQVRAKCREFGMRPDDADTVAGYLQRRKEGRRFVVRSGYRDFEFNH